VLVSLAAGRLLGMFVAREAAPSGRDRRSGRSPLSRLEPRMRSSFPIATEGATAANSRPPAAPTGPLLSVSLRSLAPSKEHRQPVGALSRTPLITRLSEHELTEVELAAERLGGA